MNKVIIAIGIVFIAIAILFLLKPVVMNRLMEFFKKGKRIYFAGLVRLVLAVIFLLGARECKQFWMIFAFGILFLISGLLIFMLGPNKLKSIIDWYQRQPVLLHRVFAVIVLAMGVVIIYSV